MDTLVVGPTMTEPARHPQEVIAINRKSDSKTLDRGQPGPAARVQVLPRDRPLTAVSARLDEGMKSCRVPLVPPAARASVSGVGPQLYAIPSFDRRRAPAAEHLDPFAGPRPITAGLVRDV